MMRRAAAVLVLLPIAAALVACGAEPPPPAATAAPEKQPTFIDPQLQALERAKQVEQTLKDEKKRTDDALREMEGG